MDSKVKTFNVDHSKLIPGIYLNELKETEDGFITIFDIRFKTPNGGDYLTPIEMHTIHHVMSTFFSQFFKEDKIYFGPMGCLTGFFLVLNNMHTVEEVSKSLSACDIFFKDLLAKNMVPAKSPYRCGNYKLLDIKSGYKAFNDFYSNKDNWGKEYPTLGDDFNEDESKYQNDIDFNVRLK